MGSFSFTAIGGAVAVYLLAQQCQCPPIAIPLITSAALQTAAAVGSASASFAGAIVGANVGHKRSVLNGREEFTVPPGVPQYNFDLCYKDLAQPSVHVTVQGPVSNNGVQVDGLPASCMVLSTVIDGNAAGGPVPTPCGSACLLYNNLSADDYAKMQTTFNNIKNA